MTREQGAIKMDIELELEERKSWQEIEERYEWEGEDLDEIAKEEVKKMKEYSINKLNDIAQKYDIELVVLNFWYNCFHN